MTKKYACPFCDTLNDADAAFCFLCGHETAEAFRSASTKVYSAPLPSESITPPVTPSPVKKTGTLVTFEKKVPSPSEPAPASLVEEPLSLILKLICLFFPIGFIIALANQGERRINALLWSVWGVVLFIVVSIVFNF